MNNSKEIRVHRRCGDLFFITQTIISLCSLYLIWRESKTDSHGRTRFVRNIVFTFAPFYYIFEVFRPPYSLWKNYILFNNHLNFCKHTSTDTLHSNLLRGISDKWLPMLVGLKHFPVAFAFLWAECFPFGSFWVVSGIVLIIWVVTCPLPIYGPISHNICCSVFTK